MHQACQEYLVFRHRTAVVNPSQYHRARNAREDLQDHRENQDRWAMRAKMARPVLPVRMATQEIPEQRDQWVHLESRESRANAVRPAKILNASRSHLVTKGRQESVVHKDHRVMMAYKDQMESLVSWAVSSISCQNYSDMFQAKRVKKGLQVATESQAWTATLVDQDHLGHRVVLANREFVRSTVPSMVASSSRMVLVVSCEHVPLDMLIYCNDRFG